jgi:nucleoside-diphosphate-sugar epimerase
MSVEPGVTWHHADLLAPDAADAVCAAVRPAGLLHFAWSLVPSGSAAPAENLRWVEATLELVRQFERHGGVRAVVAGSCAEYSWTHGYCTEDVTPLEPRSFYGAAKNAARSGCEEYVRETRLSLAWGRIFFVYGPHEPLPRLVPSIVSSLLKGEVARCTHGEQMRDYLHVHDVAHAFVTLLEKDISGPVNVGSGQAVKVRDIAMHVARRLDAEELLHLGALPVPADDPPLVAADVRRLTRDAGWSPRYSLLAGLDHTVEWWTEHRNQVGMLGGKA